MAVATVVVTISIIIIITIVIIINGFSYLEHQLNCLSSANIRKLKKHIMELNL